MSNRQKITASPPPRASIRRAWWQSPIVWVAALTVVAGLAVGLMAAGQSDDPAPTSDVAQTAFAETIGTSLPELTAPDPAIGTPAPVVNAATFDGDRVSIGGDGTARLFGFFAHWCPHCQAELPAISQWLATNALPDGVEVVAISTAVDNAAPNYPPSEWFERENWPSPVLLDSDDRALALGFGLTGFPFWVAVDSNGTVVQRVSGQLDTAGFESLLASVAPR